MKKAYYVNSIFEKLSLTGIIKAFSVLLMFSICFLGVSSESNAQTVSPDQYAVSVDHSILKDIKLNEDREGALHIVKAELELLNDQVLQVQNSAREEVVHGAKTHFLTALAVELQKNITVLNSVMTAHSRLATYAEPFNNNSQTAGFIDVEDIVELYALKLQ